VLAFVYVGGCMFVLVWEHGSKKKQMWMNKMKNYIHKKPVQATQFNGEYTEEMAELIENDYILVKEYKS
jgi:hypothetical protein